MNEHVGAYLTDHEHAVQALAAAVAPQTADAGRQLHIEYAPTRRGADLQPVLLALMAWGDEHVAPAGPPRVPAHRPLTPARLSRTRRPSPRHAPRAGARPHQSRILLIPRARQA